MSNKPLQMKKQQKRLYFQIPMTEQHVVNGKLKSTTEYIRVIAIAYHYPDAQTSDDKYDVVIDAITLPQGGDLWPLKNLEMKDVNGNKTKPFIDLVEEIEEQATREAAKLFEQSSPLFQHCANIVNAYREMEGGAA